MSTSVSTQSPTSLNPTRQQLDELEALLKRMLDLPVNPLAEADDEEGADEPPSLAPPREATPPAPSVSYTVVETASPRVIPPASGFEPRPSLLAPRLMPLAAPPEAPAVEQSPPEPDLPGEPTESGETEPAASEAEVWVPLRSTWQPSAQTWQPLAESWHQAQGATPAPKPETPPPAMPGTVTAESVPTPEAKTVEPEASPPLFAPMETPVVPAPVASEPKLTLSPEDAPVEVPSVLLPLVWFNQGFDACLAPLGAPGRWLTGIRARHALGAVGLASLAAAVAIMVSAGMGWSW